MSIADWFRGTKDVQQNKGAPAPNSHGSSQARESYEAGREAEKRRQEQARQGKK